MTQFTVMRSGIATTLLIMLLAAGCGHRSSLGPHTPTGATILGGPDVTSVSPPPPDWTSRPVVPTSQQQAQDTIVGYLKKTLQALPPGTALDATRYGGGTNTPSCKDVDTGKAPVSFATIGELNLPAGVDPVSIVAQLGDIWKSWGWYVIERDGFRKPNRFGYSPNGYILQILAKDPVTDPPTLKADSPCFSGDLRDDRSPFPTVLTAE
jgi:hypothetical protein